MENRRLHPSLLHLLRSILHSPTSRTPMRAALLLLLALAATAPTATAQGRLTGTVTDADTGETLPGVNVLVLGTSQGAATDFDGRYAIDGLRAGEYTIQASFVGYETKQFTGIGVEAGGETTLDIELGEAVLQTEGEVVVVGERPLVDVEQSSSAYTIGRDEIEAAPVREVQDVVATQAGVVQDPTGLYIRGGRADETGFIVDGVSAKDPLSGATPSPPSRSPPAASGPTSGTPPRASSPSPRATAPTNSTARSRTSATTSASTTAGARRGTRRSTRARSPGPSSRAASASSPPGRSASPTSSRASPPPRTATCFGSSAKSQQSAWQRGCASRAA